MKDTIVEGLKILVIFGMCWFMFVVGSFFK